MYFKKIKLVTSLMNLSEKYKSQIKSDLKKKLGCKNDNEVPKIEKIVVNASFGRNAKDKAFVENVFKSIERITGQKPVYTKSKKSISAFKIRQGMVIGAMVTLRGQRMWDFLEKLLVLVFSNIRDFRGVSDSVLDKNGNITIGFKDHLSFPEIRNDEVDRLHGLEVSINTSSFNKQNGKVLFDLIGFPFKQNN